MCRVFPLAKGLGKNNPTSTEKFKLLLLYLCVYVYFLYK